MTDDAIVEQGFDCAKLLVAWHLWIDAVQLPKADLLDPELLAASERLLPQIFGSRVRLPRAWAGTRQPCLGGDEHAAIRIKRFTDKLLRDIGSVRISGIDKVDAELRQALQRADGLRPVGRLTPN